MILLYAIIIIVFEAVGEGLLKRFNKADWIFELWIQWIIALLLFGIYYAFASSFYGYYVPIWKIITGFIGIRFAIFDVLWNISRGVKWNYYGTTKLYDRIMTSTGSWGWFVKIICGIVGGVFLLGIS